MSHKRPSLTSRGAVMAMIFCVAAGGSGPAVAGPIPGAGEGSIRGVLYREDGRAGLAGARVAAVSLTTGRRYSGDLTGADGAFAVPSLPASSYNIMIELGDQSIVAEGRIGVGPGQAISLSYFVGPGKSAGSQVVKVAMPKRSASQAATASSGSGAEPFWTSPGGLALIWLMSAAASTAIFNELEDNDASPSSP